MKFINLSLVCLLISAAAGCNDSTRKTETTYSADAIYFGGDIITMEGDSVVYAEAVAVKNGKIIFVGNKADAEKMKSDGTQVNDLKGKTMLPGFIDPHIHASIAASVLPVEIVSAMEWNTPKGKSVVVKDHDAFINRLKEIDKSYEDPDKVLLAWGYFKPYHGEMSREELNAISMTRPIIIWQRSCHEFYLNDAALKHFNITEADFNKMPDFCNYKEGHVFEAGLFVVAVPVLEYISNPQQFSKGLEMMTDVIHKGGLTTICEQGFPQVDLNLEQTLISKEINKPTTPFRYEMVPNAMYFYPRLKSGDNVLEFCDSLVKTGKDKMNFVKAVKFYADGAIYSQLMQVREPYLDNHHGEWMTDLDVFERAFRIFWDAGFQIHIHVNGDAGLDRVLNTLEANMKRNPRNDHRTVIVHFAVSAEDQVGRLAKLGCIVSGNPYYTVALADNYSENGLGPERADNMVRMGDVERAGVSFSFHSDMPMAPADPLYLMWCGVNRITTSGRVAAPNQIVSREGALKAVTIEAAYSLKMEDQIGSIETGKLANFTIISENPVTCDPLKIKDILVWGTVVEGSKHPVGTKNTKSSLEPRGAIESEDFSIAALNQIMKIVNGHNH